MVGGKALLLQIRQTKTKLISSAHVLLKSSSLIVNEPNATLSLWTENDWEKNSKNFWLCMFEPLGGIPVYWFELDDGLAVIRGRFMDHVIQHLQGVHTAVAVW